MIDLSQINLIDIIENIVFAVGVVKIVGFVWKYLYHPNISVKDVELVKYYPTEFDATYVDLKWRLHNNHRFLWFGNYIILMNTMYFIGKGDKGEWHWSGTVGGPKNLPIGEKTLEIKQWINEEFPEETYRVYFIVFSEDKVVHKCAHKVSLKVIDKK